MGGVVTFINGRAYKQDELLDTGKYPVLRVGNLYTTNKWYYSNLELPEYNYVNGGDLLYTWSASFGPHIWSGDKSIFHYHIWKILLKNEINILFLLQFLAMDATELLSTTNGSTMVHITKKDMEQKKIQFPSIEEQTKIGEFFKKLDDLIAVNQREGIRVKKNKIDKSTLFFFIFIFH